jgi:hypothetical protein
VGIQDDQEARMRQCFVKYGLVSETRQVTSRNLQGRHRSCLQTKTCEIDAPVYVDPGRGNG